MIFPTLNVTIERWKFNEEFGVYVSNLGHFKDRQKRNLEYKITEKGYCAIRTERGLIKAHRLVLLTWRPIPNREIMTVDHINHNKRDNSLSNLEWVSFEENQKRAKRDRVYLKEEKEKKIVANENNTKDRKLLVNGSIAMTVDDFILFIKPMNKEFIEESFRKKVNKQHKNSEFKYASFSFKVL